MGRTLGRGGVHGLLQRIECELNLELDWVEQIDMLAGIVGMVGIDEQKL